jgi:hypothetical protein
MRRSFLPFRSTVSSTGGLKVWVRDKFCLGPTAQHCSQWATLRQPVLCLVLNQNTTTKTKTEIKQKRKQKQKQKREVCIRKAMIEFANTGSGRETPQNEG